MNQLSPHVSLDSDGQTPPRNIDVVQSVLEDYAEYRRLSGAFVHLNSYPAQDVLAQEWNRRNPQTPTDVDAFYREQDAYIEDLTWLNAQAWYWSDIEKLLRKWGKVADFGGGIGSLAMVLRWLGNEVHYIDLPSPQRTYAEWRFMRHGLDIPVHDSLENLRDLDAFISVDTVEHLHPDTYTEVVRQIKQALKPEGQIGILSKFESDKQWPMHYDTQELFFDALRGCNGNG